MKKPPAPSSSLALAWLATTLGASPLSAALPGNEPAFRCGDLYFQSNALFGLSTGNFGIVRIDPTTGVSEVLIGPFGAGSTYAPNMAYDPYRDRIVTSMAPDFVTTDAYLVDAAGNADALGISSQSISNFAPTGDGRIYFTINGGLAADVHYIDATGALHQLMDVTGSAPFQLDASVGNGTLFHGMIYEPGTRSLFIATPAAVVPCSTSDTVNVHKVPLTPGGAQVAGPVQCAEYDVDALNSGEHPEGLSRGPNGDLFLVVDTNSNNQQPRMLRVDPASATITSYAQNGSYLGAAATNAGCYSHVLGRAAIVDSFAADIRLFGPGEVGNGTLMGVVDAPGTDLYGNNQQASLVEIGPIGPHYGLLGDTLSVSVSAGGTQNWSIRTEATFAGETYLVLGSLTGWAPSTSAYGLALPLVFDAYTTLTAIHAGSATFPGSFGTLGTEGEASAAIVVPPGVVGPSAVGLVLYHAALVVDGALVGVHATNALPLELIP